MDSNTSSTL